MPIGIGVNGGLLRYQVLEGVGPKQALDSLQQIRTHLSRPGRDSGVLTLFNRTSTATEMTLERKNGFQLLFAKDDRLDDTVHALRTLLKRAGKDGALRELDTYLSRPASRGNRIASRKMLEILNRHLATEGPAFDGPKRVESRGDRRGIESGGKIETLKPLLRTEASSLEDLYESADIRKGKELGRGAYGTTFLIKIGRKDQVLKEFEKPQPLSLDRSSKPNEAIGSYLTSRNRPGYLLDSVNISQPTSYVVSMTTDGNERYRLVTPHEMRSLVKDARRTGSEVLCHGIVMPKARGKEVGRLIREGLDETAKRQVIRSTLQSIKGLNERGFVHRDIKPDNSLFDEDTGITTLIDTGTLFKAHKNQEKHPGTQFAGTEFAGTMRYVHPRGLRGEEFGTETDLHALGVMALEVAHPGIFKLLGEPMLAGVTKEWLFRKIEQKIEDNPRDRDKLVALRSDLDNPDTISGFAMLCIEKASLPKEDWSNRDWAQQAYSDLLDHPVLR
jgi:serine/threonine protein kinase